jgi:PhzF family phenazine biosynthesis protein
MIKRAIRHVDAFTSVALEGNPAAVVDGEGIDDATMQRIALNQHLSETVFLLPPASGGNHARLRIFTPDQELPFAGHPTLSAAHVLISEARVRLAAGEMLRLETGAGVIPVEVNAVGPSAIYTMTQASPQFAPAGVDAATIASWLGLRPDDVVQVENVSTGLFWLIARIASFEAMLRVQPDYAALQGKEISIFCIGAEAPEASIRVRTFAPAKGVFEDPVTGSSNGCIAALIARDGLLQARNGELQYIAEQGVEMGQPGRVLARVTGIPGDITVQIGGHAVTVLSGDLLLPA